MIMENKEFENTNFENTPTIISNIDTHELASIETPYTLSLRITDINSEKELKRFIRQCEGIIRKSPEYRVWTNYIRDVLGYVSCDLTKENHSQCSCDIHHHPISLYMITKAVILNYIAISKEFCSADIAVKVLELHYENRVGFISIIRSLHEKFHNGFLQLPMQLIHGDYKSFITAYGKYLEEDDLDTINGRLDINFDNCGFGPKYYWSQNKYIIDNDESIVGRA
jgi:hypothetical protein